MNKTLLLLTCVLTASGCSTLEKHTDLDISIGHDVRDVLTGSQEIVTVNWYYDSTYKCTAGLSHTSTLLSGKPFNNKPEQVLQVIPQIKCKLF